MADYTDFVPLVSGQQVVIHCGKMYGPYDGCIVQIERSKPKCDHCGETMAFVRDSKSDALIEIWRCPKCDHHDEFLVDMYGCDDVDMTEAEYQDYLHAGRVRKMLRARYGTASPDDIRDFWFINKTSEG